MSLDLFANSFFIETRKILLLKTVLSFFSWRIIDLCYPSFKSYLAAVTNPYQQIRDAVGSVINDILQLIWKPDLQSFEAWLQSNLEDWIQVSPNSSKGVRLFGGETTPNEDFIKLFADLAVWRKEAWSIGDFSRYANASKTSILFC